MDKKGEEWEEVMEGKRVLPKYSAVEQAHYDLKKSRAFTKITRDKNLETHWKHLREERRDCERVLAETLVFNERFFEWEKF